jgi:hypothetical protein
MLVSSGAVPLPLFAISCAAELDEFDADDYEEDAKGKASVSRPPLLCACLKLTDA